MISAQKYDARSKDTWNSFLKTAKNATFLFERDYMDYHSDRFEDASLMVTRDGVVECIMPASLESASAIVSHGGLTYGGFVFRKDARLCSALQLISGALRYLHENGISTLKLRAFPAFYNSVPADETDYAMFLLDARLYRRDTSMGVFTSDLIPYTKDRRQRLRKIDRAALSVRQAADFEAFWETVLTPNLLARHGVRPVHSLEEIALLQSRFPDNIKLYCVYRNTELLAGAVMYEARDVAHLQYSSVTDAGKECDALDRLIDFLITEQYRGLRCFDFGICNEAAGRYLNKGLAHYKESFGARCLCHNFYEIDTARYPALDSVVS